MLEAQYAVTDDESRESSWCWLAWTSDQLADAFHADMSNQQQGVDETTISRDTVTPAHLDIGHRLCAGLLQRLCNLAAEARQPPQLRGLQQLTHRCLAQDHCRSMADRCYLVMSAPDHLASVIAASIQKPQQAAAGGSNMGLWSDCSFAFEQTVQHRFACLSSRRVCHAGWRALPGACWPRHRSTPAAPALPALHCRVATLEGSAGDQISVRIKEKYTDE